VLILILKHVALLHQNLLVCLASCFVILAVAIGAHWLLIDAILLVDRVVGGVTGRFDQRLSVFFGFEDGIDLLLHLGHLDVELVQILAPLLPLLFRQRIQAGFALTERVHQSLSVVLQLVVYAARFLPRLHFLLPVLQQLLQDCQRFFAPLVVFVERNLSHYN